MSQPTPVPSTPKSFLTLLALAFVTLSIILGGVAALMLSLPLALLAVISGVASATFAVLSLRETL